MRLAIEERELNKMAALEKLDDVMQVKLLSREAELADKKKDLLNLQEKMGKVSGEWTKEREGLLLELKVRSTILPFV